MIDTNKVVDALRNVLDPNTGQDIISVSILAFGVVLHHDGGLGHGGPELFSVRM